jgi:hypothetical protein
MPEEIYAGAGYKALVNDSAEIKFVADKGTSALMSVAEAREAKSVRGTPASERQSLNARLTAKEDMTGNIDFHRASDDKHLVCVEPSVLDKAIDAAEEILNDPAKRLVADLREIDTVARAGKLMDGVKFESTRSHNREAMRTLFEHGFYPLDAAGEAGDNDHYVFAVHEDSDHL